MRVGLPQIQDLFAYIVRLFPVFARLTPLLLPLTKYSPLFPPILQEVKFFSKQIASGQFSFTVVSSYLLAISPPPRHLRNPPPHRGVPSIKAIFFSQAWASPFFLVMRASFFSLSNTKRSPPFENRICPLKEHPLPPNRTILPSLSPMRLSFFRYFPPNIFCDRLIANWFSSALQ